MTYIIKYQNNILIHKNIISAFSTPHLSKLHPLSQFLLLFVISLKNPVNQYFYNKIQHFCLTKVYLRLLVLYSILQIQKNDKINIHYLCSTNNSCETFINTIYKTLVKSIKSKK